MKGHASLVTKKFRWQLNQDTSDHYWRPEFFPVSHTTPAVKWYEHKLRILSLLQEMPQCSSTIATSMTVIYATKSATSGKDDSLSYMWLANLATSTTEMLWPLKKTPSCHLLDSIVDHTPSLF